MTGANDTWPELYQQFGADPTQAANQRMVETFRRRCIERKRAP